MILHPNKNGIDPVLETILSYIKSDKVSLIPIVKHRDFIFNPDLLNLKTPYILFDFCEYGANTWDRKETHFFGKNSSSFGFKGDEWAKFDDFINTNPPLIYFKRELLKKDVSDTVLPIEYPAWHKPAYITKESFETKPLEVFFNWGYSHESRRMLHGNIFVHGVKNNINVIDSFNNISFEIKNSKPSDRLWASIFTPYYSRINNHDVYEFQSLSKLSVSLAGAGIKCFRHSEAPLNSVMVKQQDPLAWSYEWIHKVNCIEVPLGDSMNDIRGLNGSPEIQAIEDALKGDLYDIYMAGIENCSNYFITYYINEYITPSIGKRL